VASSNDESAQAPQVEEAERSQKVFTVLPDGIAKGQRPDAGTKESPGPESGPPLTGMPPTQQQSKEYQPPAQEE